MDLKGNTWVIKFKVNAAWMIVRVLNLQNFWEKNKS
jgi:hypothetical protein